MNEGKPSSKMVVFHAGETICAADTSCMIELSSQIELLSSALDLAHENHRVISQNIANVNTPGYKTKRLDFEAIMESVENGQKISPSQLEVAVREELGLPERQDHNNVSLEAEVSELKKNALLAQAYSHLVASKVSTIRRAIQG